jgi:hypothetical protein
MRFLISIMTLAATATAELTTLVQGFATPTVTITKSLDARAASVATTSIAVYTPDTTMDSWECATRNYSDYLQPPMPTGDLLEVYINHAHDIYEECEKDLRPPFTTYPACPSMAKASWCAVSL